MHISSILVLLARGPVSSRALFTAYTVTLHPLDARLCLLSLSRIFSSRLAVLHAQQAISQSLHHCCSPPSHVPLARVVATGLDPARHRTTPIPPAGHSILSRAWALALGSGLRPYRPSPLAASRYGQQPLDDVSRRRLPRLWRLHLCRPGASSSSPAQEGPHEGLAHQHPPPAAVLCLRHHGAAHALQREVSVSHHPGAAAAVSQERETDRVPVHATGVSQAPPPSASSASHPSSLFAASDYTSNSYADTTAAAFARRCPPAAVASLVPDRHAM